MRNDKLKIMQPTCGDVLCAYTTIVSNIRVWMHWRSLTDFVRHDLKSGADLLLVLVALPRTHDRATVLTSLPSLLFLRVGSDAPASENVEHDQRDACPWCSDEVYTDQMEIDLHVCTWT